MSGDEQQFQLEQRSSVKLVRNAKGDPQWEIKVVAGDEEADVERARQLALDQYRDLETEFDLADHGAEARP